ncbi:hypothetical protein [Bacillus paranthracis]|uniref:hypothetical protein n=1 Tax=Bacillus paranthracis TaxID=2026186 RepID=UPI0007784972|nr:hypothetical protein [Bacillus paranthracis]KXY07451.1 hypothetical protein AT271_06465 [Bacillus cereus]MCC2437289.1 hypothetical protein [Bacillus paranthracis]MDG1605780.1 hypothetical protein [Bacillus paranthracis]
MGNFSELIGKKIGKKQLPLLIPTIDITKKGGAFQTEIRHARAYANIEVVGRKYIVHEVYDTPIELVHGNTGKEPANKGQHREDSLKYKLAFALIMNFAREDSSFALTEAKSFHLRMLDSHLRNFKHIDQMFYGKDFDKLNYITQKLANNNSKALDKFYKEAIKLIKDGIFPGVQLGEQLYYANFNHEHYEFDESNDIYELYDLYREARAEAEAIVNAEHGNFLFFSKWSQLVNSEYHELILDEKYRPLFDGKIDYIYSRYFFIGKLEQQDVIKPYDYETFNYDGSNETTEDIDAQLAAEDFIIEFQKHRKQCSVELIDNEIKKGILGIIDFDELRQFAEDFTMLLFDNDEYETFVMKFKELMENVRNYKPTGF